MLMASISPLKDKDQETVIKKEEPTICCLQKTYFTDRNKQCLRVNGW
jgi:hypothetical protein